jgi:hypothetical protein
VCSKFAVASFLRVFATRTTFIYPSITAPGSSHGPTSLASSVRTSLIWFRTGDCDDICVPKLLARLRGRRLLVFVFVVPVDLRLETSDQKNANLALQPFQDIQSFVPLLLFVHLILPVSVCSNGEGRPLGRKRLKPRDHGKGCEVIEVFKQLNPMKVDWRQQRRCGRPELTTNQHCELGASALDDLRCCSLLFSTESGISGESHDLPIPFLSPRVPSGPDVPDVTAPTRNIAMVARLILSSATQTALHDQCASNWRQRYGP